MGVFDLRKAEPLVVKDHLYDTAIVDLKFHRAAGDHTGRQRIVSADSHVVKVRTKACCLTLQISMQHNTFKHRHQREGSLRTLVSDRCDVSWGLWPGSQVTVPQKRRCTRLYRSARLNDIALTLISLATLPPPRYPTESTPVASQLTP